MFNLFSTRKPHGLHRRLPLLVAMSTVAGMTAHAAEPIIHSSTQTLPTIQVSAHPLNRSADDLISPSNIIEPERLFQQNSSTLAEALDGQLGVRAETFGAGAARPVIRGQTAPRVKVLSDGATRCVRDFT